MRKYLLLGIIGVLFLVIAACGGDDPTAVPTASPTAAPTQAPIETAATTAPVGQTQASSSLRDIAAKLAGGPGAIYLGDLNQLVGPAPTKGEGDAEGTVPLFALEIHKYV